MTGNMTAAPAISSSPLSVEVPWQWLRNTTDELVRLRLRHRNDAHSRLRRGLVLSSVCTARHAAPDSRSWRKGEESGGGTHPGAAQLAPSLSAIASMLVRSVRDPGSLFFLAGRSSCSCAIFFLAGRPRLRASGSAPWPARSGRRLYHLLPYQQLATREPTDRAQLNSCSSAATRQRSLLRLWSRLRPQNGAREAPVGSTRWQHAWQVVGKSGRTLVLVPSPLLSSEIWLCALAEGLCPSMCSQRAARHSNASRTRAAR